MSERLFIWNAKTVGWNLTHPWIVSPRRGKDDECLDVFRTLPEAHDFAKGFLAAERATP